MTLAAIICAIIIGLWLCANIAYLLLLGRR